MKKILLFLTVCLMAVFSSCHNDKKSDTPSVPVDTALNFDSVVVKDYETVKLLTSDSVVFYEAQIEFNRNFTSDTIPEPVRIVTVMQSPDTVWTITHAICESPVIDKVFGFWCEDIKVDLSDVNISLDSAIVCMNKANMKNPDTNLCVFRNPLCPAPNKNAYYIFGSNHTSYVSVDCKTGDVKSVKAYNNSYKADKK